MKTKNIYLFLVAFIIMLSIFSCRKEFLDAKPSAALVVPSTLEDFQALLDNFRYMNGATPRTMGSSGAYGGPNPMLLEVAADNYYIPDNYFNTFLEYYKSIYLWSSTNPYGGIETLPDWNSPYRAVFYANVVLDGLESLPFTPENQSEWNNIKGSALFFRAWAFFQLSQVFAPVYDSSSAAEQLGIPLRITSDVSTTSVRSSLKETYDLIIEDLNATLGLLPLEPLYKTRPSIPAAYGLLARIYLNMEDYENARFFSEKFLDTYNKPLINYNEVQDTSYPFIQFNDEVVFSSLLNNLPNIHLYAPNYARIDSAFYESYSDNDLRKMLFFISRETNTYSFRGSYDGSNYLFCGIASDEQYIILAEALIRLHNVPEGINYLNSLLRNRYKEIDGVSSFRNYSVTNEDEALTLVLSERRKELLMRGLRFGDLRRLNKDPRFARTIHRKINGEIHELSPNDLRYTWPIPDDVIALTGMAQNPR